MIQPDPSTVRFGGPWIHRDVHANGIRFHVVETADAPSDAPLVVLLHGFADFWWSWRHQLTALSSAGFRAVAVDLRGYGDTDKPPRGYDGWTLAGDVVGLIRALGYTNATLVGHADGGLVCWATAALHPRMTRAIGLVGSPHPIALRHGVLRDKGQRRALLPFFLRYQVPIAPERALTKDDGAAVERILRARTSASWQNSDEFDGVATQMRSAIRIAGAAHCALEYQRWAFRSQFRSDGRRFMQAMDTTLDIPVLQIHGEHDPYVLRKTVAADAKWAPQRRLHTVVGAGHYTHQEAPDEVTAELLALCRDQP
ncbi:alpha/beta hydrolase [Rhodococcus sp. BP-252]|uniref:alpha/beta fold hydrolase n=1 Tax=unclassified Rhodococcus (in: high G+C Gram-positive bacteria) TaxID=192944 RepID=UPI001C9ACABD|nr:MULTISPECIES: alpha/beta hydrolase [unclassified Rhodococcus (in: high G+C Gram-positive bacteria)]MBY6410886.1 alpha/beta hydrolase [Rhodococcus sp. BP-320]MBY6415289.1 alpha/beta hydrolase [Rhodococcus sp. BP-321]MBY6419904.1 alpha/beta hydrolase [Rhodococcus sp. BP-324]MBY6425442.1 alpha/beta hydrolase [Rhodococcus sp. BP-323]MBY6430495.1 alpha/beta hydrolase [Rhodococcus sp. BP-322]